MLLYAFEAMPPRAIIFAMPFAPRDFHCRKSARQIHFAQRGYLRAHYCFSMPRDAISSYDITCRAYRRRIHHFPFHFLSRFHRAQPPCLRDACFPCSVVQCGMWWWVVCTEGEVRVWCMVATRGGWQCVRWQGVCMVCVVRVQVGVVCACVRVCGVKRCGSVVCYARK